MTYRVNVYAEEDYCNAPVVARVGYNTNLDYWDGSNHQHGGAGLHLGITQLRTSGRYVLIYGSQWDGSRDYGLVVSDREALAAILRSGNDALLGQPKYRRLKTLCNGLDSD